ncbi:sulfatase [Myxococcota bacterium]|nr:sulfatase [Myxococcota bacterium]
MNRREFLKVSAGLAGSALTLGLPSGCRTPRNPSDMNILMMIVEDTTAGALGCYGNPIALTPALDRLAASGVQFDRAYCQASGCNASRTSLLTGLRPDTTGVYGNRDPMDELLPPGARTLPELVAASGNFGAGLGKIFHHAFMAERPLRAFDRLELGELPDEYPGVSTGYQRDPDAPPIPAPRFRYSADPDLERELSALMEERQRVREKFPPGSREWMAASIPFRSLQSELVGDSGKADEAEIDGQRARMAARMLGEFAQSGQQFCMAVGFTTPHVPLVAPREYIDLYDPNEIPLPEARPENDQGIPPVALRFGRNFDLFHRVEPTPQRIRAAIAAYYGCVSFVDAQVGLVLDALDREGLADDTIVIFFADHGFHLGEHGLWSKVTLFDQSIRVPLIVRLPGASGNGSRSPRLVELVDVLPTLANWWGQQSGVPFEGTSLAPLLEDPARPWKQAAYSMCKMKPQLLGRSVHTPRYRYAEWDAGTGVELYDLEHDPWEQRNLALDPRHRDVAIEHARLLRAGWRAALPHQQA